jgi:small subunit ribosomal protein S7
VRAIENAAPCEEVTTVQYGGIRHPKAVETSPQRRIDLALRWICQGAKNRSKKSKLHIWDTLANEVIAASNEDSKSFSVSKRNEVERQAAGSR